MFPDMLIFLRKRSKLTQSQLADKLNIARSTIAMYEGGKREPDFETLEAIADFFNVNMSTLLGEEQKHQKETSYFDGGLPSGKEKKPDPDDEDELNEYLEMLRTRPECRMLLKTMRGATKAEVEENVRFIEALRQARHEGSE